jgi:hypothetical protein
VLGRRSFEDFIKEAVRRAKKRGGADFDLSRKLGKSVTTIYRWGSDKPSGTGVRIENLRALLELAGYELGDCLYFPDEVSHLRAVEIEVFKREKKEPG